MKTVLRFFIINFVAIVGLGSMHTFAANNHEGDGTTANFSGHVRTRYELTDNSVGASTKLNDAFLNRARLNVDLMPVDTLKVRISPYATWLWNGAPTTTFDVKEGWMAWMPTDMLSLFVGRQELVYGKGRVFGKRDWSQKGVTHDAARVRVSHDYGNTDFFWIKNSENQFTGATGESVLSSAPRGDENIFSLYNSFNLEDMTGFVKTLDVYGLIDWQKKIGGTSGTDTKLWSFGGLIDGGMNELDYNTEATLQFGEYAGTEKVVGFSWDAEAGYTLMEKHRVGLGFTYVNDEYKQAADFSDVHGVRGDADLLNKNNLMAFNVNAMAKLTDEFDLGATGWWFMKAKKKSEAPFATTVTNSEKRQLAFELDFKGGYNAEDNLRFEAGYAVFIPRGDLDEANLKTVNDIYVQGTLKF